MIGCVVQHQHHLHLARLDVVLGEVVERVLERFVVDPGHDEPVRPACPWMNKCIEVKPLEPWPDQRHTGLTLLGPTLAQDGLQAHAVLVEGPDFYSSRGIVSGVCNNIDCVWESFFLNSSWSSELLRR